jgi:hypothetical protein
VKNRPQCKDIPDEVILKACDDFFAAMRGDARIAQTPDEALADRWPPKLILAKMESMVRRGLLEYGVSLRTAWRKEQK